MDYEIISDIPDFLYPKLLNLVHRSFEEHKKNGLLFTCSRYSIGDLQNKVLRGKCFVVLDSSQNPIGLTSVSVRGNGKFAYENITAISPECKGMGLGTELYKIRKKYLIELGCEYMLSDTAVDATSSVKWHLEKCKCNLVGYKSFCSTNYYSYVFREDFVEISFFQRRVKYPIYFLSSFVFCRLTKRIDGSYTSFGKFLKLLIK